MRLLIPSLLALSGLLTAQLPTPGSTTLRLLSGNQQRFVDFSDQLDRAQASVVVGTLGKFRDGKKKRVDSPKAHTGGIGTVIRASGTQYFEVQTRTKIAVEDCPAGKPLKGKVSLAFKVQLTRRSDGSVQRMVIGAERQELEAGMRALFVLDRAPKSKGYHIVHVIPMKVGQKKADFAKDVTDFVAVNQRLSALRRLHAEAKDVATVEAKKVIAKCEALLDEEIEFENTANERLELTVLRPWEARLKKRVEKLRGSGG